MMVRTLSAAVAACLFLAFALVGAPAQASEHDALIAKHAAAHGLPEALVRRVIHIETKGNPRLVSKGNYGLMQIRLGTARAMGYSGGADGLLDANTNMTYAVKYLAGAYRAAGGNHERAIRNYQKGYYYEAKRQGFTPYTVASATQQAAAPDPIMVQEEASRRQAIEMQRQAAVQSRLEEQKLAEQQRTAAREAAQQEKVARQQAIEQARIEQKNAIEQQRVAQREAAAQERAARQQAREQQQVVQRHAMLQQQIDRDQARQQQRIEHEQMRERTRGQQQLEQQVAQQQAARLAVAAAAAPRVTPVRRAAADPGYSWYNPMRFFKHPAHQAHPYRPEER